ncbi:MAG TPA: RagB/SusD family nutrient uptake outer membrane protein, partial [Saprospiraceae bacterium]|nr:RagB/SusD family nutrient uptake outer membrane protein [Saprospiraceae bacterium]
MKSIFQKIISALSVVLLLTLGACEIDLVTDPNNPSLGSALNDAKKPELQVLVTGLEARHRGYVQNAVEMFGREVWAYFGSDPRFANEWLGLSIAQTYPDFFSSGGTYVNPYLAVKQANVLIRAAENSTALTDAERKGYIGFAKTIKGFQLLWPLMQQYENGIRIDVEDPLNPGPTLPFDQAIPAEHLAAQLGRQLLGRRLIGKGRRALGHGGHTDLLAAGSTFSFNLTSGFAGFNTPDKMAQVNRAIAARAALYAKDYSGALNTLNGSFMDLNVTDVTFE